MLNFSKRLKYPKGFKISYNELQLIPEIKLTFEQLNKTTLKNVRIHIDALNRGLDISKYIGIKPYLIICDSLLRIYNTNYDKLNALNLLNNIDKQIEVDLQLTKIQKKAKMITTFMCKIE